MVLFLSLAITFFLLAAGVTSHRANKVCQFVQGKVPWAHDFDIAMTL